MNFRWIILIFPTYISLAYIGTILQRMSINLINDNEVNECAQNQWKASMPSERALKDCVCALMYFWISAYVTSPRPTKVLPSKLTLGALYPECNACCACSKTGLLSLLSALTVVRLNIYNPDI